MTTATAVASPPSGTPLPPPIGPLRRRRAPAPRTVLAVASLGVLIAFIDATIVNIAFPSIERSFPRSTITDLSWVLSAYNIVFAAFLVAAGRIADLIGRRRVFVLSLGLFTIASGLCAAAPSLGLLIAARIVQAFAAAFLIPSSLALVLAAFDEEHRAHAVALWTAVAAAAAGIGPSLGGLLVSISDWRLVFLVNVPIGIAAIVLTRRLLVESRAPGKRRVPDLPGSAIFALAVSLLVLAIVKGQDWHWTSARVLGCLAAAAALGAVFVRRCATHRDPLIDLRLLRIRDFTVANGMTLVASAGFFGYTLCNVLFLTTAWRYSVLQAGLALTPGPIVAVIVAGPTSRIAARYGARVVAVPGGLLWGAGVLWMIYRVGAVPDFLGQWLPGMVLLGLGAGTASPNVSGAAVAAAPGRHFATATALNSVARQVGAALGIAVVVSLIGTPAPNAVVAAFHHAWTFAAICLIVTGVAGLALGRRLSSADPSELPSLASATRAVLTSLPPAEDAPALAPPPRARREPTLVPPPHVAESTADFLGRVPLFAELDRALRDTIAAHSRELHLPAGEWLFREGDDGDALYVVRAGRLDVVSADGTLLWVAGRGAALGELALLTGSPRAASVRAARASDLIAVDRAEFESLLDAAPALSRALNRALSEQLRISRGAVPRARPRPVTIALVPLDADAPAATIGHALASALSRFGSTALLTDANAPAGTSDETPLARFGPMLDRCEAEHEHVVLVCPGTSTEDPWTRFCLQQADRVLAVTRGGTPPAGWSAPAELHGCDLVGCDVAPASGALAPWVATLEPIECHALDTGGGIDHDVARIARRLAGRSIGIVLSGGGARAFSHLGVLEELRAAGITIDRVAGVSMGAYIGGMLAMGLPPEEMDARCYEEFVRRRPLGDYTLPRHALIRGDRVRSLLARTFADVAIEELPLSYFCASADLRSAELVVHRDGLLREHVGMSMALPIIGPPQIHEGRLVVDGSLVDNLPVATMAGLAEGPIIAVDVKATFERPPLPSTNGDVPASARQPRTPLLGETLTRVLLMASSNTSEAAERHAQLIIKPHSAGIGLLEFHQLDAAREAGRAAAREVLADAPAFLRG